MRALTKTTQAASSMADRGAVLLLAIVFVLMLSIVATTVLRSAVMQFHMAGNDQFLEEALHGAHAIAEELSLNAEHFSLAGAVGDTNCAQGRVYQACDRSQLQIPSSAIGLDDTSVDYRVVRQEPLFWKGFPFRESEHSVSSAIQFDAAMFEIDVRLNGSEARMGSAHIVQGIAVRVASFR